MNRAARSGFTLIEVLAVLFLTTMVIGVALNFFVNLSNQSARATETTREVRRATSLLDRIARDFERTILIRKPAETDPLAHPWLFLAEARSTLDGADRVRFVTRRSPEGRFFAPQNDISVVTYALRNRVDGGSDLMRSTSPLPEQLEREFPLDDDPEALTLAEHVDRFSVRFLGESGEWTSEWDSSQLLDSSELPVAVEIEIALADDPETDSDDLDFAEEPLSYVRRVLLPLRPLDMLALFDPEAAADAGDEPDGEEGEDDPSDGRTIAECLRQDGEGLSALSPTEREAFSTFVERARTTPFAGFADLYCGHPAVLPDCCI